MKTTVSKQSDASVDRIFSILRQSLKQDYFDNTKNQINDKEIKEGLTYVKYFGNNDQSSVKVEVSTLLENELYEATFVSNRGKQIVSYKLQTNEMGKTIVELSQETVPITLFQKINDYLVSFLLKKSLERKLSAQLIALNNAVVN